MNRRIAAEAEILRCGYDLGFFDKSDIASWADRQIDAVETPSTALIDLAMIRHTHPVDVLQMLRTFASPDLESSIPIHIGFIGLLFQSRRISLQLAIRGLWTLVYESGVTEEQRRAIYHLDDGYDLALRGVYGSVGDVERRFWEFVAPFADRLRRSFPHLITEGRQSGQA